MATHEFLMEASAFAYREGYKEGTGNLSEVEDKHWSECRQISEYEAENRKLQEIIKSLDSIVKTLCEAVSDTPCGCDCCPYSETNDEEECEVGRLRYKVSKLIGGAENG